MLTRLRRSPVAFLDRLADHATAPALISADGSLTYAELADRVDRAAERIGTAPGEHGAETTVRKVIVVPLRPDAESVVGYLAVLRAGHVAAVVAPGQEASLAGFVPELLMDGERPVPLGVEGMHGGPVHPELSVLLSTSGSTGSAKLVRLSHRNVQSNAEAIARSLGLEAADRGITSLPLHYCYGLSVLHSHLAVGAAIVLGDAQVHQHGFWNAVRRNRVSTIAGVPHSFTMMLRTGWLERALPSVRRFTVAGGALTPEDAATLRSLGAANGWDLYVMYGQTEATARMAVLNPAEAVAGAGSVGRAIPGGRFQIDPAVPAAATLARQLGRDVGEVVYHGPNVMLGYATGRADLALGREVDRLRTGDLGYLDDRGLLRIVGRLSGFVKVNGRRVDLADLERLVLEVADEACVTGDDDGVQIAFATAGRIHEGDVKDVVVRRTGLPRRSIQVVGVTTLPRLASGKVDRQAVRELAQRRDLGQGHAAVAAPVSPEQLLPRMVAMYRECLDRPDVTPEDSFVSLGGDSLSFVELSVRLEAEIGTLAEDWQHRTVQQLVAAARPRSRWAAVETSVVLRAVAALTILGTHIGIFTLLGGAHTLLVVLGFNLARFGLSAPDGRDRVRRLARSLAGIAVPAVIWILVATALFDAYRWPNMLLMNWLAGSPGWSDTDQLWFIETAVWSIAVLLGLFAIPPVRRWYDARPLAVVGVLLAIALVPRFLVLPHMEGAVRGLVPFGLWLVVLGMAAALAQTRRARLTLSVVAAASTAGFYGMPGREAYIVLGALGLIWLRHVRVPRWVVPVLTPVAAASLYVYLIQWQVFPHVANPVLAFALSLAAGLLAWYAVRRCQRLIHRTRRGSRPRPTPSMITT